MGVGGGGKSSEGYLKMIPAQSTHLDVHFRKPTRRNILKHPANKMPQTRVDIPFKPPLVPMFFQ